MRARFTDEERALLEHVGREIRRLRRRRGWTLADLGQKMGETLQTVQKLEVATTAISVPQLHAVAQAFGVTPGALLPGPRP